jgi:hypothetical protein
VVGKEGGGGGEVYKNLREEEMNIGYNILELSK